MSDEPLEPRTATLLALAGPCQMLEIVRPRSAADRKVAKRRIAEATEQVPAAEAVKHVIDAMTVAISVAATGRGGRLELRRCPQATPRRSAASRRNRAARASGSVSKRGMTFVPSSSTDSSTTS